MRSTPANAETPERPGLQSAHHPSAAILALAAAFSFALPPDRLEDSHWTHRVARFAANVSPIADHESGSSSSRGDTLHQPRAIRRTLGDPGIALLFLPVPAMYSWASHLGLAAVLSPWAGEHGTSVHCALLAGWSIVLALVVYFVSKKLHAMVPAGEARCACAMLFISVFTTGIVGMEPPALLGALWFLGTCATLRHCWVAAGLSLTFSTLMDLWSLPILAWSAIVCARRQGARRLVALLCPLGVAAIVLAVAAASSPPLRAEILRPIVSIRRDLQSAGSGAPFVSLGARALTCMCLQPFSLLAVIGIVRAILDRRWSLVPFLFPLAIVVLRSSACTGASQAPPLLELLAATPALAMLATADLPIFERSPARSLLFEALCVVTAVHTGLSLFVPGALALSESPRDFYRLSVHGFLSFAPDSALFRVYPQFFALGVTAAIWSFLRLATPRQDAASFPAGNDAGPRGSRSTQAQR